ncbi:MAG: chemotaxis protein CheW [Salinivirgaceae bacterium]|nr:chemotaxis protein CheW [Salinivirgaceae bacterium]
MMKLITFKLANQTFALPLADVERVIQVVEMRKLPKTPKSICGIINMHGEILPVINIRLLFMLPVREIELSDQLIIATISSRKVALLVDSTHDVVEIDEEEIIKADKIMFGMKYVTGVVKLENNMVLINDIAKFLSPEELTKLEVEIKNQKPQTKNQKPKTPNPKPQTPNPKPETTNPKQQTKNQKP